MNDIGEKMDFDEREALGSAVKEFKGKESNLDRSLRGPWTRIVMRFWWVVHIFGCQEKWLTAPYVVRYCGRCGRMRFESKKVEKKYRKMMKRKYGNRSLRKNKISVEQGETTVE